MALSKSDSPSGILTHIAALRRCVLHMAAAYFLCCIGSWIAAPYLLKYLLRYAAPPGFTLHYFGLMEPFFVRLELTLVTALLLSFPFSLAKVWEFITPALQEKERHALLPVVLVSTLLGYGGVAVALFFMVPAVVNFSLSFTTPEVMPMIGISQFVSLLMAMVLGGGIIFQFPLLTYALLAAGVTTPQSMGKKRPYIVVLILIVAAILTPPDVASQLLMAIPAWLLFEATLLLYRLRHRESKQ